MRTRVDVRGLVNRPLSQVGSRRKRRPGQLGQGGMGSIPANPSTKHASCFPPSSMPASIEISIKLIVCLRGLVSLSGPGAVRVPRAGSDWSFRSWSETLPI
jgi:hypothetical protein